jgi:hypothetical protein
MAVSPTITSNLTAQNVEASLVVCVPVMVTDGKPFGLRCTLVLAPKAKVQP